jgi:hypothetical protein
MNERTVAFLIPRQLHFLEFSNVLRTCERRGELTRDLASDIYALHLDAPLREIDAVVANLLATAFDVQSTTYDAA